MRRLFTPTIVGWTLAIVISCQLGVLYIKHDIATEAAEPKSGTITKMIHHRRQTRLQPVMPGINIPITQQEKFEIHYVEDGRHGDAEVTAEQFARYQVGDRFPEGK